MPKAIRLYVRYVDAVNRAVGRSVMWLVLVMMLVLLYAVIARSVFGVSYIWIIETSQMLLAAYYILGGGYSLQLGTHVRMDLLYSRWSERTKARMELVDLGIGDLLSGGAAARRHLQHGLRDRI